jgi:hypothetical protein
MKAKTIAETKWVYHLDKSDPQPTASNYPTVYRVCIAVADEPGLYPTGEGGEKEPWYWDEEFCEEMNRRRGYPPDKVMEVLSSIHRI